jgi:hypothetical protein
VLAACDHVSRVEKGLKGDRPITPPFPFAKVEFKKGDLKLSSESFLQCHLSGERSRIHESFRKCSINSVYYYQSLLSHPTPFSIEPHPPTILLDCLRPSLLHGCSPFYAEPEKRRTCMQYTMRCRMPFPEMNAPIYT